MAQGFALDRIVADENVHPTFRAGIAQGLVRALSAPRIGAIAHPDFPPFVMPKGLPWAMECELSAIEVQCVRYARTLIATGTKPGDADAWALDPRLEYAGLHFSLLMKGGNDGNAVYFLGQYITFLMAQAEARRDGQPAPVQVWEA